ncbi:MAG TPA: 50S ribosomal protein L17 [Kiritimatiellia bacterium]|nr:50S ribosomal protein L17 [Kiritimatiellia bacterium]
MRHRKKTIKLGRTTAHRESLLANLVSSLIAAKRIKTTLPKARAARSLAEKMVTLGKQGDLAARRRAIATIKNTQAVSELFSTLAPAFKDRNGGYTRIYKLGKRSSDSSEMALLEWVNYVPPAPKKVADEKSAKLKSSKADKPAVDKKEE